MVSKASGLTTLGILFYTSFAYNSAMKLPFVFIFIKKSEQDKQFKCLLTLMFFPENQGNGLFDKLHSFGVVPIMTIYSDTMYLSMSINDPSYQPLTRRLGLDDREEFDFYMTQCHVTAVSTCQLLYQSARLERMLWSLRPSGGFDTGCHVGPFLKMFVE